MTVVSAVCGTFWGCLYAYQTLIAGVLAVGAAAVTAGVIWYAAHLPVKAQERREEALTERRRVYGLMALSAELSTLMISIGHVRGAIGAAGFDPLQQRDISLEAPPIIGDWETVSLLPPEMIRRCQALAVSVHHHNRSLPGIAEALRAIHRHDRVRWHLDSLDRMRDLAGELRQEADALLDAEDE